MPITEQTEMYGQSMTGQVRVNNEDSLAFDASTGIAIVADGMGGHTGGEIASAIAVSAALRALYRNIDDLHGDPESGPTTLLDDAIRRANQAVVDAGERNRQNLGMGTTLLATRFDHHSLTVGNIGDCRLYRFREGQLKCLTRDHTLVAETGDRTFSPNILTRAIGMREASIPDIYTFSSKPGDLYLLCSDGLSGPVKEPQIQLALADFGANLGATAAELFRLTHEAGSPDNVTLILVKVH